MKITIVGSAHSVHISKIANDLARLGHHVTVFSEERSDHHLSPQVYLSSVRVYDRWPRQRLLRKFSFLMKLNLYCIYNRVDVLWLVYASSYGLLAGKVFGAKKVVSSVWGSDILVNGYKKAFMHKIASSLDKADLILSTSRFLRFHTFRFTSTPIVVTPYGPQDNFYLKERNQLRELESSRLDSMLSGFDKIVLCTKWLKHVYGIDILIEAVNCDADFFRTNKVGVLIAGEGQDSETFKDQVNQLGLGDIVKFVGHLNASEVIELLDVASVTVFPSRSESFGVSVLESFARRVPVIMSGAGGFKEIGLNGRYGIQIDSFEPSEYCKSIKKVLSGELPYSLEEAAFHSESYSWGRCIGTTVHYLNQLLEGKGLFDENERLPNINLPKILYIHSESQYRERDLARARTLRVFGIGEEFSKSYEVFEIGAGLQGVRGLNQMFNHLFKAHSFEFVYIEGSAAATVESAYQRLRCVLKYAAEKRLKVIYFLPDAHEFWDDYLLSTGSAYKVHLARWRKVRLLKLLEKSGVVTIGVPTSEFRTELLAKLSLYGEPGIALEPWLEIPPAINNSMQIKLGGSENKFKFVYAGGIGPFYKLHRWLIMLKDYPEPRLENEIIVRHRDLAALDNSYRELIKLSRVNVVHGELPTYYEGCNVIGVLLIEPTEYIQIAFPLKFFSYLSRGWPIVAYEGTVVGRVVEEHGLGWVVPNSVDALVEFFSSKTYVTEYESCRENVLEFRKSQTWKDRVQRIVDVA